MKHFLLSVLLALSTVTWGATDPSERYLDAYFLIQDGDEAEAAGHWTQAAAKFTAALRILNEIQADAPDWHTTLLLFRTKYCREHLESIKPKLPVAPPPSAPAPAPAPLPAPATEAEQVRQLQSQLEMARTEVQKLTELRDKLTTQLEEKLKEPAPSDRRTAQQTLEQLRALQALNEATNTKLEQAREKALRADQLEAQLQRAQENIRGLEVERTGLNAKLQEAIGKLSAAEGSTQVDDLLKKNAELTAQLASAQAEITQMRDEMIGAGKEPSGEAVSLRAQIGQLSSELEQTRTLLAQRTEELSLTRGELEQVRAENVRLTRSQEEIMARLSENERQLRAARASTEKDNEIIEQLRKENALLQEIAGKKEAQVKAPPPATAKGFLWFKPKQPATPAAEPSTEESTVSRSEDSKLTAAVKAPGRPEAAEPAAPPPVPAAPTESPIIHSLLADARAAVARGELEMAAAKFQSVLDQEPGNVTALINLSVVHYQQGRLEQAEEVLHKAIVAAPNNSQGRSVLGVVYFRKGRIEDAYNELTRAVALNPRNAEAHNYLGIVMSEKGWATAAEQEVRRALELNPEYADAHFNLSVIYARQRTPRLELARYHYQRARELGAERDPQLETKLGLEPSVPVQ